MILKTLLESIEVVAHVGAVNVEIEGVACDSRKVRPGWLFVAVSGHKVDGAQFVADALGNGAVAVVSESLIELGPGVACIQVDCARRALAEISNAYFGDLSHRLNVVGVTGTNGKTTTAYMIRDVLRAGGSKPGLLGTVSYEIGEYTLPALRTTPEAPEIHAMFQKMDKAGCDSVVMEVSSHAIDLHRIRDIDFKIGVFTNLTQDHLDYHKDMDSYFDVKAKLFRAPEQKDDRFSVINLDDPWGRRLVEERNLRKNVVTYGFGDAAMVRATDASVDRHGTCFHVVTPWGEARICLKLLGRFNIHNALAAVAVGGLWGIDLKTTVGALENIQAVRGRLEQVPNRKGRKIFVDYAHTDDALKNVLTTLREICRGKLVVVFGCGGDRDRGKRLKMGRVAAELADYSIVTSDNPRTEDPSAIASEIVSGFSGTKQFEVLLDRREAIEQGIRMIGRKDILLIAGKGHETYQEINGAVIPFDDGQIVREALG